MGRQLSAPDRGRVHPIAESGFQQAADAYERGRPGYPEEALELLANELGIDQGSTVVDLAAGTGKLTRQLIGRAGRVVAVEPLPAMRTQLADAAPGAIVIDGTAEEIPLDDGSVDAVAVAQAFHWFEPQPALAEIHRVLRPQGGLAMLWNQRDESVPWVARLGEIIQRQRHAPYAFNVTWEDVVAASGAFTPLQVRHLPHGQQLDAGGLVDRMLSTSFVATLPPDERDDIARRVSEVAAELPDRFVLPYTCHVYWCRRRD